MHVRDEFQLWLTDGKKGKYSSEAILGCIDRISEYAVSKRLSGYDIWECTNHDAFRSVYRSLIESKFLRITDKNLHKMFTDVGQLYLLFLKEKPFIRKTGITTIADESDVKSEFVPEKTHKICINPENVITWLITQPNANGTLYLENVVRQYMGTLRSAPSKLEILDELDIRNIFTCHTPNELNIYWDIFKAAPNYKIVNNSTSGMFSAGLGCYLKYLKHLENITTSIEKLEELPERKTIQHPISDVNISSEVLFVNFSRPELCAQSRPLTCTIKGQDVLLRKQNWSQLLVAISEHFIKDDYPNITSLYNNPLYGSKVFFQPQKINSGSCAQLSNGKWIYTNFNPQTIVTIIRYLCQYCEVDLNNVIITYEPKAGKRVKAVGSSTRYDFNVAAELSKQVLDSVLVEKLTDVLSNHFSNGYRLNSSIEMMRFRLFATEDLGDELTLSDEELKSYIMACGTTFDGKLYTVSIEAEERIRELAGEYFANGSQIIFFAEFYSKNENWLFEASVVSEGMLIDILRRVFPGLSFTKTYFGNIDSTVFLAIESEILRVWGEGILITYDELAERLKYIPLERIKSTLGQNGNFIWSSVETFSHISRIDIAEKERAAIIETTVHECNSRGYVSIKDLPYIEIEERNYELSITAIHNAIYRICLCEKFDKKGKIITRKGDIFDAQAIMKEYCRTIDKCSLDDLLNFEKELTGNVHRWISMGVGNTVLVRIDRDTYVADKHVHFNTEMIDAVIELFVTGDYLPLKSFTTFAVFPHCGQKWNLFLLESYCRRFSKKFRFDTPSVNSRNAGTIIRKSCMMDYTEIMTDAILEAGLQLDDTSVGKFLYESGYTGRSSAAKVREILEKAKAIRKRMD